ncbi:DNA polymerase III subunit alpha [Marinihelvus fidelis]|uniref:DNA polymerase III subunit alpha n=1 Tax=Marinihelvus fidelis TaxID=2613842 RepID=A0A5N0TEY3_9GAMM|nr:DNA polymerase III subunit alpha [Marinihelvus fidelis]KAA9133171.1 DNA polymerase III subunit alpha [Marinihelvus fidelis]
MTDTFVHLHLHSEYSLVDSTLRLKPLIAKTRESGMPAVAITDQNNLFALVKFYRQAVAAGLKPIVGADVLLHNPDDPKHPSRLVLLAQDRGGYLNLCRLLSLGYLEGQEHGVPYLTREWVSAHAEGLIALSAAREGDIGMALLANHPKRARTLAAGWARDFPDRFYIEVQRTGREGEKLYEPLALALAAELQLPVVATNDVRFIDSADFEAHEARVCIREGRLLADKRREQRYSDQQYLKSPEEMQALFSDLPEALDNAVEIARRCNLELTFGEYFLPDFPTPEGESVNDFLRRVSAEGLAELLDTYGPSEGRTAEEYLERLETELDVIISMGFPGYFLIVADFIRWAKDNDVPVGPGRGSGAGSVVAWALGITGLDPLKYDLLFERFLNPERVSMPDFDVDFCMEKRDRVIDYVAQRYGRDQVSQIITYGTMAAKAVVRDAGRVLGHGYGFVDSIAKLVPLELGITLSKALEAEPELRRRYDEEEDTRAVLDLALSLEGLTRNAGKHAGGVVIAPSALTDFSPLFCEPGGGGVVTQFDKDDVESVGLVKFDFLGLRTLTIIDWATQTINARREAEGLEPLDLEALPLDDEVTFRLLRACQTTAVFQLESRGMKELIRKLQPDSFEEIIALVALFRPGPLESGMVDSYIKRKHGQEKVSVPHEKVRDILVPTNGVILYQEQVMQIAQEMAGYSLGDADILRRAMGKKKPEEMAKQREIFVNGSVERGIEEKTASFIFDQMETFAGYGFNKSHSAAYALISYQTGWLKAHYPADFMAAVLSADMDNTDKVGFMIDECRAMNLGVVPPDINRSMFPFTVIDDARIRYGLGALKGLGRSAIESIIAEREARGPFTDLPDFCDRVDLQKVNRRALETLVRSGAMDPLDADGNRARMLNALDTVLHAAEQSQRDREAGQSDMFGAASGESTGISVDIPDCPPWPELQRLFAEKEALGLFLTGHPTQVHQRDLERFTTCQLGKVGNLVPPNEEGRRGRAVEMTLGGLVAAQRRTNRGQFVTIEDHGGRVEVALFDDAFSRYADLLGKDEMVVVEGRVSADDFSGGYRMSASRVMSLAEAKSRFARGVSFSVQGPDEELPGLLASTFAPYRDGAGTVYVEYRNPRARASLQLGEEWRVRPCEELVAALGELDAVLAARLVY